MNKIYKVYFAYKGMQSWMDCSIRYFKSEYYPTETDLLRYINRNRSVCDSIIYS
jgi:hypothetical protein